MMNNFKRNRFLIARRIVQISILVLFIGANYWGWYFVKGNLSAAYIFESFYLADPYAGLQILASGVLLSTDIIIGSVIVLLFYALIAGRSFCSWVCPMNIITDLALWLRKKMPFKQTKKVLNISRKTRFGILLLSFIVSAIMGVAAFEFVSPISILHRSIIYGFGTGILLVIGVFIFDLLILKNGWCGYLCPLGAFYTLISKKSLIRVYHTKDNCTDCLDCKKVCPEIQVLDIINKKNRAISYGACNNCGRCIEVCLDNALKFSVKK